MKTSELTGAALDWAVAKCEGKPVLVIGDTVYDKWAIDEGCDGDNSLHYSTDWAQGGPIIEREGITVRRHTDALWDASVGRPNYIAGGPTPLIAAMRCYVASKLGDEIEVPGGLC